MGSKPDRGTANGGTAYGHAAINDLLREEAHEAGAVAKLSPIHGEVLKTFRVLIADLCEQFGGGHPGSAMGMAAIGVALWKYVMRYAPHAPTWFNRDRFVLSNGHTCLFQYTFLYLTGYKQMTLEKLKATTPMIQKPSAPAIQRWSTKGLKLPRVLWVRA
jgi:dihydroxyacetone synthase